jgi:DNA-binding MurR/RpiR family transcriptional regulator
VKDRPLTQRLHDAYAALPGRERAVADLILDAPGDLASWSASELAAKAATSAATVSRLFQRLGYDGYEDARRAARAARAAGSPLYLAGREAGAAENADAAAVEMTLAMQNPLTIADIAERLAAAPRVRVAGFRHSAFIADYLHTALGRFRPGAAPLPRPGQTLAEAAADLGPGDVAVVIGFRRRPAGFARLVATLAATGADVALIADRSVRESPAAAHWTLLAAVETPDTLDSYAGAMALARRLVLEAGARLGADGRRRLDRIEALHADLGELE